MTDVRMGLKHVILQRVQSLDTTTEYKRITDFSINRILSNEDRSSKKDNDILDLSKTGTGSVRGFSNFHHQPPPGGYEKFAYHFANPFVGRALNFGATTTPRSSVGGTMGDVACGTSSGSSEVIRPRVCKFFNPSSVQNCNDCEMFYKNFSLPKYPVYKDSTTNMWFGATAAAQFVHSQEFVENLLVNSVTVNVHAQTGVGSVSKVQPVKGPVKTGKDTEDESSFKCAICDKVFGCADTLQSHEKTHKSPRYECVDCGKGFSQLRNYKYHLSVHRGTKEFAAECSECGKTFNDKGYLSSHMKIHRNKKEYECPYCPKSFNQRVAFNMHVRIHTGVKPHKCTECGKRFSRKMLLKQHMRTHSGEKPYQCSVCGKSFADRSNMTLHHRLHSGIKPFNCPICPKAFTKKHHLKTHLNYHTGCKPYVCPHPNCNQAFTQSSNMRTHAKKCQFKPVQYPVISTQLPSVMSPAVTSRSLPMPTLPFQC